MISILVSAPQQSSAAPAAYLWDRWSIHDPASPARVDHAAWNEWLERFVFVDDDGISKVRYEDLSGDRYEALVDYVEYLESVSVSTLNRDEQLAYWINLYNATTIGVVAQHLPVGSITDIDTSPGLFSNGPWGEKLLSVEGESVSLGDIHHRILRPIWRDPRIHYVLNCGALGCPNLWPAAITGATVESVLEEAADLFINHRRGSRVEYSRLIVSSLYIWFLDDFGGEPGLIAHLKRFADGRLAERLERVKDVDRHEFDWVLNGTGNVLPPIPLSERGS